MVRTHTHTHNIDLLKHKTQVALGDGVNRGRNNQPAAAIGPYSYHGNR